MIEQDDLGLFFFKCPLNINLWHQMRNREKGNMAQTIKQKKSAETDRKKMSHINLP